MATPKEYRAFLLDNYGHVTKRHDFDAFDDDDALKKGRQYVDGHDVEVWQLGRVIGKLKRGE